jgi:epoxyqueuosine reductase
VRNVLTAIGNSENLALAGEAERLLTDPSGLVRGAAIWALGQLDRNRLTDIASSRRAAEDDPAVEAEWAAALAEAG